MKKIFFIILSVNLLSSFVYATFSRINGMGIDSWMIKDDDTLIWLNPAYTAKFKNVIFCEAGNSEGSGKPPAVNENISISNQWGGLTYSIRNVVLSLFFLKPYEGIFKDIDLEVIDVPEIEPVISKITGVPQINFNVKEPVNRLNAGFSILLNENVDIGMGLNISGNTENYVYESKSQAPSVSSGVIVCERYTSDINWLIGANISNTGIFSRIDASIKFEIPYANNYISENNYGITGNQEYSLVVQPGSSLTLGFRTINEVIDNVDLITGFSLGTKEITLSEIRKNDVNNNGRYTDIDEIVSISRSVIAENIIFGCSLNTKITEKALAIFSFAFKRDVLRKSGKVEAQNSGTMAEDDSVENVFISYPVVVSYESKINKNIYLRMGINYPAFITQEIKLMDRDYFISSDPLIITKTESSSELLTNPSVSFGAGIKLTDSFFIDLCIRKEVLFSGTYLLSGLPETLFSQITLMTRF